MRSKTTTKDYNVRIRITEVRNRQKPKSAQERKNEGLIKFLTTTQKRDPMRKPIF